MPVPQTSAAARGLRLCFVLFYKNTLVREYFGSDMLKELTRTAKEKGLM